MSIASLLINLKDGGIETMAKRKMTTLLQPYVYIPAAFPSSNISFSVYFSPFTPVVQAKILCFSPPHNNCVSRGNEMMKQYTKLHTLQANICVFIFFGCLLFILSLAQGLDSHNNISKNKYTYIFHQFFSDIQY